MTDKYTLDLSNQPISFNEESDYFSDGIKKSFADPFDININDDIFEKLSLINIDNISRYNTKIYGTLIIEDQFYDAYISINKSKGDKAEMGIFYGKETLKVFDKKLPQLPFETISVPTDLPTYANAQITQGWPDVTHNFPKVFREGLTEKTGYEYFENFINNYKFNGSTWEFPVNSIDLIEGVNTIVNRNIMAPFVYLMEILKVGFQTEGLEVRGEFADDAFNHKILLAPKKYFELYSASEYLDYSFSNFTSQEIVLVDLVNRTVNIYSQTHTPTAEGVYNISININMSSYVAQYFKLTIVQNGITLYSAFSRDSAVNINETISINVVTAAVNQDIVVEMRLFYQTTDITNYNRFNYKFNDGYLNVFPTSYNLVDYLPNMTFKELLNHIKTRFNVTLTYTQGSVYIDYLENRLEKFIFSDLSDTDQPEPERTLDKNNLFRLLLPTGEELLADKNGQTYSDADYTPGEIEKIEIKTHALKIASNNGSVTAAYPEDIEDNDVYFLLYGGLVGNEPLSVDKISNQSLSLQDTYDLYYRKWLQFRANSETYKEEFFIHAKQKIDIKDGLYKHNKHHLIKSLVREQVNEDYWHIELETETL